MLTKFYKVSALEEKAKDDWKEYRKKDKLKYTIPRDGDTCNVHSIVQHTSNGKTDFMYSVILNGLVEDMLPAYIKEALLWLIN